MDFPIGASHMMHSYPSIIFSMQYFPNVYSTVIINKRQAFIQHYCLRECVFLYYNILQLLAQFKAGAASLRVCYRNGKSLISWLTGLYVRDII